MSELKPCPHRATWRPSIRQNNGSVTLYSDDAEMTVERWCAECGALLAVAHNGERLWHKPRNTRADSDGWVAVEDGLPEHCLSVLITYGPRSNPAVTIAFYDASAKRWYAKGDPISPWAWRPLPDPYTPDRED